MTAPRCTLCRGILDQCAVLNDCDTCTSCAIKALRASRRPPASVATTLEAAYPIFLAVLAEVGVGGVVHQRDVRPRVRGRMESHLVGRCYSRAKADRILTEISRERSNDVIGRNTNKDEPVYAYSPARIGAAA